MAARLDVEQLIEGITGRQPRRSFLIGAEQIARRVEGQRDGKADASADDLAPRKIRRHLQDRAALAMQIVARLACRLVDQIGISEIRATQAKVNVSIAVKRHSERIDV